MHISGIPACSEYGNAIVGVSPRLGFGICGPLHEHDPDRRQKLLRDEKKKRDHWKGKKNRKQTNKQNKHQRPRERDI